MFQIKSIFTLKMPLYISIALLSITFVPLALHAEDGNGQDHHGAHEQPEAQRDEHNDHPNEHDDHQEEGEHHDEGPVNIAADIAQEAGIGVTTVQPVTLEIVSQAYGKLVIPPNQEAHVHARFPGLVKDINVHVGDRVAKGDVIAVIESNESLRDYTVKAPMSGIVTKRQLNLGEVADDQPLVVITDDNLLWGELKIFPHQRGAVKRGQSVYLGRDSREFEAVITHMAPSDNDAPYMLARVDVDNKEQTFTPGELVQAEIVLEKVLVPIAVANRAVHTLEGQQVVFVQEGDAYERRALKLGRTDGHFTEVLQGLQAGETYVVDNSYLIKADIEKAGAGHHH